MQIDFSVFVDSTKQHLLYNQEYTVMIDIPKLNVNRTFKFRTEYYPFFVTVEDVMMVAPDVISMFDRDLIIKEIIETSKLVEIKLRANWIMVFPVGLTDQTLSTMNTFVQAEYVKRLVAKNLITKYKLSLIKEPQRISKQTGDVQVYKEYYNSLDKLLDGLEQELNDYEMMLFGRTWVKTAVRANSSSPYPLSGRKF